MKFFTYVGLFVASIAIAYFMMGMDYPDSEAYTFDDPTPTSTSSYQFDPTEPSETDPTFATEPSETDPTEPEPTEPEPDEPTVSSDSPLYYDQLNAFQKQVYDIMLEPVSKAQASFEITNIDTATFLKESELAFIALQRDHPEYFWYMGGSKYTYWTAERRVIVEPYYYDYVQALFDSEGKYTELMQQVDTVADLASAATQDDYERMVYVHDYLIRTAIYDHDALKDSRSTSSNPSSFYIYSAYGCLVNRKTVCAGYAMAYKLILNRLGYDCLYVVGNAGESHAWNLVYLENEGYYIDVTWDDPDFTPEIPLYNYAFITQEALNRTHTTDQYFTLPDCTATDYNFYKQNNYYLETYDYNAAIDILNSQTDGNALYIQFGSSDQMKIALEELCTKGRWYENSASSTFQRYTWNDDHYTITFMK